MNKPKLASMNNDCGVDQQNEAIKYKEYQEEVTDVETRSVLATNSAACMGCVEK